MLRPDQAADLPGCTVFDPQDEELGTVEEVFLDAGDDEPAWVAVALEERTVLVPLADAELDGDELRVRHPRDLVAAAPDVGGEALDPEAQDLLYTHYGLTDADLRDDTGWSATRPPGEGREQGTSGHDGADDADPDELGHP